jgi:hypothetical protein
LDLVQRIEKWPTCNDKTWKWDCELSQVRSTRPASRAAAIGSTPRQSGSSCDGGKGRLSLDTNPGALVLSGNTNTASGPLGEAAH